MIMEVDGESTDRDGATLDREKAARRGMGDGVSIDFDVGNIDLDVMYGYYRGYQQVLEDVIGLERDKSVDIEELVRCTVKGLDRYTTEETIGLTLYYFNLILVNWEGMSQSTIGMVGESIIQIIKHCIEEKNGTAIYFSLECIEMIGGENTSSIMIDYLMRMYRTVKNNDIVGKIVSVLVGLQTEDQMVLLDMLDEASEEKKRSILISAFYHPGIIRSVIVPLMIEEIHNKSNPVSRKNQSLLVLSKLGMLLESEECIRLLSSIIRSSLYNLELSSKCLITAGSAGVNEYTHILKTDSISDRCRSILCASLRFLKTDPVLPSIQISISLVKNELGEDYQSTQRNSKWRISSSECDTGVDSDGMETLHISMQEAESIFRGYLLSKGAHPFSSQFKSVNNKRLLFSYSVLSLHTSSSRHKKTPKNIISLLVDHLDSPDSLIRESALNSMGVVGSGWPHLCIPKIEE